jgi:hypothetical protein
MSELSSIEPHPLLEPLKVLTGEVGNLTEAIALHRQMAAEVPDQHSGRSVHRLQAAATLMERFDRRPRRPPVAASAVFRGG